MSEADRRTYVLAAAIIIAALLSSLILRSAIASGAKVICVGFEGDKRVTACP